MAVQKPPMVHIGTNGQNIFPSGGLRKVAIVCHVAEGTLAGVDAWFSNPAAKASANYCVGKDGQIHEYVDPQSTACPWANGIIDKPAATVTALLATMQNANPNLLSVSIEHEGMSGEALTPAQRDASAHLAAWLIETFAIPNDENHLLGHYEFDSVTRAGCPGWNRQQWLEWEAAINHHLGVQPTPTPAPAEPLAEHVRDAMNARLTAGAAKARQIGDAFHELADILDPAQPVPGGGA